MNQSSESVSEWMRSQATHFFVIEKQEQKDTDLVRIQVKHVETEHRGVHDPDDYVAEHTLLIHGDGLHIGETEAALPQSVYEIPLIGEYSFQAGDGAYRITTDRATYVIRPEMVH
jgi:hypothetical protein